MKLRSFKIREERADDLTSICDVVMLAFDRNLEADLVNTLPKAGAVTLSLVAIAQDETIGHILFSPGTIESDNISEPAVAWGPVAVLPERQHLGRGSALVTRGLEESQRKGYSVAFLLGHPEYYPRFGFVPSSTKEITCKFADGDAFMVGELRPGGLQGVNGFARYRPEFARF